MLPPTLKLPEGLVPHFDWTPSSCSVGYHAASSTKHSLLVPFLYWISRVHILKLALLRA